jgi:uncharacterized protein (UPF0276 family)
MSTLAHRALGFGLGLRPQHYEAVLQDRISIDWLEVLTDNYLVPGGRPLHYLARIRERFPLAMHGVALSIGSTDELDRGYLRQVRLLADRFEPAWISDHLCWTGVAGRNTHDLLPLPYTEEVLRHVIERIGVVQDILGRRLVLENVSSYVTFAASTITEWEFLRAVAEKADCLILLDINNVYVSGINHEFDPLVYLNAIPVERVQQLHLAGHQDYGTYLIDTHDRAIAAPVWELFGAAVRRFGAVSTSIERDAAIPAFEELLAELETARSLALQARARAA